MAVEMDFVNKVTLEGNISRVGKECAPLYSGGNEFYFAMAVKYSGKTEKGVPISELSFFRIKLVDEVARANKDKCIVGRFIRVDGKAEIQEWVDNKNNHSQRMVVAAQNIQFDIDKGE